MEGIVSGVAGVAVILDGESLFSLHAHLPGELVLRRAGELQVLFRDAHDLVFLDDTTASAVREELHVATEAAGGLQLALIVLDRETAADVRTEAAADLRELLVDARIRERLADLMYSHALPADVDSPPAELLEHRETRDYFRCLFDDQPRIAIVDEAFSSLEGECLGAGFGSEWVRLAAAATTSGVRRELVAVVAGRANRARALTRAMLLREAEALQPLFGSCRALMTRLFAAVTSCEDPGAAEKWLHDSTAAGETYAGLVAWHAPLKDELLISAARRAAGDAEQVAIIGETLLEHLPDDRATYLARVVQAVLREPEAGTALCRYLTEEAARRGIVQFSVVPELRAEGMTKSAISHVIAEDLLDSSTPSYFFEIPDSVMECVTQMISRTRHQSQGLQNVVKNVVKKVKSHRAEVLQWAG
ncbi:MAG: hypothetical protein ABIE42_08450 [Candidatus Eisenbacteria bacterium]